MTAVTEVPVGTQSIEVFSQLVGETPVASARRLGDRLRRRLRGRTVWNINSTGKGGGVAEMLAGLLPYARGVGVDARWLVAGGSEEFFRLTKRIHHAIHGSAGDGTPLDERARRLYEGTLSRCCDELTGVIQAGDFAILHDPQTAGLIPALSRHGARVIWRSHIGTEFTNSEVEAGWAFLRPYLEEADAVVFTRREYVPGFIDVERTAIIAPSIDPFSAKNQEMPEAVVAAILAFTGITDGRMPDALPEYVRKDGSRARVVRHADVMSLGPPPSPLAPLVVQVSRWDPLKDPVGVMAGFEHYMHAFDDTGAHLVLAGPSVRSVQDDPEQSVVMDAVIQAWRELPHGMRARIHLVNLPMADVDENAAIVNALQRHATVVVQKSLREGFGLTVTEAMWKRRPVVATAVGGIRDQITDGVNGLLIRDPKDMPAFAEALAQLLSNPRLARRLGEAARKTVLERYLPLRHLSQFARLILSLDG